MNRTVEYRPAQDSCRRGSLARVRLEAGRFRPLLVMGVACGALLAGAGASSADGLTFIWTGLDNGTSYGRAGNWSTVQIEGGTPILDGDGNPLFEQRPVLDANGDPVVDEDGNGLFENAPMLDAEGEPVLDENGEPVFIPLLEEARSVSGPPTGLDNMYLVDGTPNISANGWHVNDVDLLGGEFIIRTGAAATVPGQYFVDGTMTIGGTGKLTVSSDAKGQNVVQARQVDITGGTAQGTGILRVTGYTTATHEQEAGIGITQSGGLVTGLLVETPSYEMSGGTLSAQVNFQTLFALSGTGTVTSDLTGGPGSVMTQSGGTMSGTLSGADVFTQSGGILSGTVIVRTYNLTGAAATSTGGAIDASQSFNLAPQSGTAIIDALLSGDGGIVKSGGSTVVLTNAGNSFTGSVVVKEGTLDILNDALTDGVAVTIDPDAILKLTTTADTLYTGSMTGEQGDLVKAGAAAATLAGNINLGDLWIDAGRVNIGTGTTTNEAVFDSATVAAGSTLYIAKNATLTIRKPKHLVNNGDLINDGTVHDDLDNTGTFTNNQIYNANVATNSGTINNNTPGFWTGNIVTNAGSIYNNTGSTWTGNVLGNSGLLSNMPGGTWKGIVKGNTGGISNNGDWLGAVEMNGTLGVDTGLNYGKIIYNSTTGTWTGDIKANSSWILNAGGTWTGNIEANNAEIWNDNAAGEVGTGYWIGDVMGNNSGIFNGGGGNWSGDIYANSGYVKSDKGAIWTGDVLGNSYVVENRGVWTGDVVSNSRALYNTGVWNGDVFAGNTGFIINGDDIVDDQTDGTWFGDVNGNGSTGHIENRGGVWTGSVLANDGTISNTSGILSKVVTGDATWVGDVVTNAGTVDNAAGSTWQGDVLSNTGTIATAGVWTGAFTNSGTVNAQNQIVGAFTNSGLLHLTGSLTGITALTNTGTSDKTAIIDLTGNGARQTLNAASVTFGAHSLLKLDVDIAGNSDRLVLAGAATLDGLVYLSGTQASGMADLTTPYEFLSADSVTGSFAGVTADLAFLNPTLTYDSNSAFVTLARNAQAFTAVGVSENQKSVAAAVEALGAGNDIYDAVLFLSQEEAQSAFDQLSGEPYASVATASIEGAHMISAIGINRISQLFGGVDDGEANASGYAAGPVTDTRQATEVGFWTQFYGAVGAVAATQSTSGMDSSVGGVAFGIDGELDEWRLGMMFHAGITTATVSALDSVSTSTDYGVGVYGGRQWGGTTLSLEASYTGHDVRNTRDVTFLGFTDSLSAAYASGTAQANAQLSQKFDLGAMSLTPYAGVAYVSHMTDGFTEAGGAAALTSDASVINATFATLGMSVDRQFVVGDDMLLTAKASLGWRSTFADNPDASYALGGGSSFSVVGSPVVSDMAVFAAGLNLDVSASTMLDLAYEGQVGGGSQSHALQGTWSTSF